MTSISKNVYLNKLDDIVNKYNNAYHWTIKMKPVDKNPSMYFDFNKESNKEGPKFKVGDNVRISKYENIFGKVSIPIWTGEVFLMKNIKNIVPWTYVISDLKDEETVGRLYEKKLQKTNQKELRVE